MNYNKQKNDLYEIDYSNKVLFYTNTCLSDCETDTLKVNVSNRSLYKVISERYGLKITPALLIYKQLVEPNSTKIEDIKKNKIKYLGEEYKKIINSAQLVLFLKGDIHKPYCKYSKRVVSILSKYVNDLNEIVYYDVFMNDEMRDAVKVFSNCTTFPQVYVNGTLIGGCDKITELDNLNKFQDLL